MLIHFIGAICIDSLSSQLILLFIATATVVVTSNNNDNCIWLWYSKNNSTMPSYGMPFVLMSTSKLLNLLQQQMPTIYSPCCFHAGSTTWMTCCAFLWQWQIPAIYSPYCFHASSTIDDLLHPFAVSNDYQQFACPTASILAVLHGWLAVPFCGNEYLQFIYPIASMLVAL